MGRIEQSGGFVLSALGTARWQVLKSIYATREDVGAFFLYRFFSLLSFWKMHVSAFLGTHEQHNMTQITLLSISLSLSFQLPSE